MSSPLEIARRVIDHSVPQRQVLRAGGGVDRVGLYDAEFVVARPRVAGLSRDRATA